MQSFSQSIKRILVSRRRQASLGLAVVVGVLTLVAFDQPAGTKLWHFYTGTSIQSSAAIGAHGQVYFGTDSGKLYCFYADGRGMWEYPTRDRIVASPAIGADGTIYFGSYDATLYAMAPEGIERWRFQADGPIASSPAIGPRGIIVFGSLNKRLFAVRPDGSKIWDVKMSSQVVASPAIAPDGTVYAPTADGVVTALNVYDGEVKWEFEAPNRVVSSPAIGHDGTIYFGCFDGHLYALTPEGKKKWTFATGGPISSSPAIGPDGMIYIGSDDRQLYALAPDGFKKWTFTVGKWIRSTPTITADGTVYVGSYDQSLYAIGPNGAKKWEFVTDGQLTASPALSHDGDIYLGSWDGHMYAIRGSSGLAVGVWPRFRGGSSQAGYLGTSTAPKVSAPVVAQVAPPVSPAPTTKVATAKTGKSGSAIGRWWGRVFGGSAKPKRSAPPVQVAQQTQPAPVTKTVVVTRTNALTSEQERAYQARMAAMEQQVANLNSELAVARQPQPSVAAPAATMTMTMGNATIIADSATLVASAPPSAPAPRPAETKFVDVTSAQEIAYQRQIAAMESQVANLNVELEEAQATAPIRQSPGTVTMAMAAPTLVAPTVSPPPTVVSTSMRSDGRIPMMSLRGAPIPTPQTMVEPVTTSTFVSPPPVVSLPPVAEPTTVVSPSLSDPSAEIDAAWGVKPEKKKRGWFNWFGRDKSEERPRSAPQPAPAVDDAANQREIEYMKRISALEGRIQELNAEVANRRDETDVLSAPRVVTESGEQRIIADSANLNVVHHAEAELPPAEPKRPGFFKRMFSRSSDDDRAVTTVESGEQSNSAIVSVRTVSTEPIESDSSVSTSMVDVGADRAVGSELTAMEERMTGMRSELATTRQDRDELRRQLKAEASAADAKAASLVSRSEAESIADNSNRGYERISGDGVDEGISDKLSRVESQLLSLSEELGNARVDRARIREELARVRSGGAAPIRFESVTATPAQPEKTVMTSSSVVSAPASPGNWSRDEFVNPGAFASVVPPASTPVARAMRPNRPSVAAPAVVQPTISAASQPTVSAISQPAWLSNEVRSVITAGDPWSLPPGTTAPAITQPSFTSIDTRAESLAPAPPGILTTPAITIPEAQPEKEEKRGFFKRLFGIGSKPKPKTFKATNIVIVPTQPPAGRSIPPDAQLLGTDPTALANSMQQTNFPRVKFTGITTNTSFIQPGMGNLSQLPGFPRPTPAMVAPPTRQLDPWVSSKEGLRTVDLHESVTHVGGLRTVSTAVSVPVSKPTVLVVSPADKSNLNSPVLDLRGTAQSARRVAQVLVSINGAPFVPAAGLENWSFQEQISSGLVLVRVKALDADGQESKIVTHTYQHQSASTLRLNVVGSGMVEPDLSGKELEIGRPYTITARPAPGHEFVRWSGGAESNSPKLQFLMNNNLWLRAEFRRTPVNFSPGQFAGLIYPQDVLSADKCGYFELAVDAGGKFSGSLQLAGSTVGLQGQFDEEGNAVQSLSSGSGEPVKIHLRLDADRSGESVSGQFEANGTLVSMQAYRRVQPGDQLSGIQPGRYTLVIPGPPDSASSPGGDGIGELRVQADGSAEFYGELSDGTSVRQQTHVSRNGIWPLYVPMYGGRGMLTGWVTVTNHAEMDLFGDLRWIKPETPGDRFYPQGFGSRRFVVGSSYSVAAAVAATNDLSGILRGGNLGSIVLREDMNSSTPLVAPEGQAVKNFSYNLNPDTGLIEGSFIHPETRTPTPFRGVYVQKRGWGSGYFMGTNTSGMVHLQLQ